MRRERAGVLSFLRGEVLGGTADSAEVAAPLFLGITRMPLRKPSAFQPKGVMEEGTQRCQPDAR